MLLTFLCGCATPNWSRLSKNIRREQMQMVRQYKEAPYYFMIEDEINTYHSYRKRFDVLELLDINLQNDTIFIIETNGDLTAKNVSCTIFSRRNLLSYYEYKDHDKNDSLVVLNKPLFTKFILKQTINWNITLLQKEGKENSSIPQTLIRLTRVILSNGTIMIDCETSLEPFNFERDISDFNNYDFKNMEIILYELFNE